MGDKEEAAERGLDEETQAEGGERGPVTRKTPRRTHGRSVFGEGTAAGKSSANRASRLVFFFSLPCGHRRELLAPPGP